MPPAPGSVRVSDRLTPRLSVAQLQACVEVKDQRNTDFVFLTLSGFDSAAATATRANVWAEEVVRFTREMQSQECRETRQFLQQQVDATDTELRRLNEQMLEFAKRENIIDSDKQIDAALRSLGDIDLKYETARINLDTIEFKIKGAEDELRRQSPLADKLRSLRAELDDLRARYTDENPLVVEKREALTTLEEQLKAAATNTQAAASSFTGTELGNTLYLNFIQYQSERQALTRERDELKKLRDTAGAKLDAIPEKAAAYAQLSLRRQSLETARGLLFSRLREAQLFEENAPGYYRVFEPALADRVVTRGKSMKVALVTALAAALLAAFAATAAAGAELLDTRVRTPREAARVLHAPLFAAFPEGDATQADAARSVWARWIGAAGGKPELRAVWVPSPGNGESAFWAAMLPHAAGLLPVLHVVDTVGDLPAPPAELAARITVERLPIASLSLADTQRLAAGWRDETRRGREVWLRLCGPVQEPGATLARACAPLLALVRLHAEDTAFWKTQADLLASMTGRPAGVVALGERNWRDWS